MLQALTDPMGLNEISYKFLGKYMVLLLHKSVSKSRQLWRFIAPENYSLCGGSAVSFEGSGGNRFPSNPPLEGTD